MQVTTVAVPFRSSGEAIRASLAGALNTILAGIPRLIGFLVILLVGWLVSGLLAKGTAALLHAVRFNDLARRSGFAGFVEKMGVRQDASGVIASVVKWFVRLIALVVAFDMLGLPAVSGVLQQLLLWLPNLIVALVVLVIGGLAANALAQLVRGTSAQAGFTNPGVLAAVTRVAVWAFAVVVAVNQLGIATTLINTLLVGVVGALALASGLAFGLGGRDKAAQLLDRLGRQTDAAAPKLERVAAELRADIREQARSASSAVDAVPNPGWIPRSGKDRRRVARAGADRRAVVG